MAGFFGRFVAGSGDTDDQGALCGFDDVVGDGVEFLDLQDPLDLGEEAFEEPEVAAGDPCDVRFTPNRGGFLMPLLG